LQPWPPPSTRGPERRLIGRHPQRRLTGFSYQPTKIVLRRPLESAEVARQLGFAPLLEQFAGIASELRIRIEIGASSLQSVADELCSLLEG